MQNAAQEDEAQIRKLVADWHTAAQAGDVDAVLGLMADDVVFLLPGNHPIGKDEFAAMSRPAAGEALPKIEGLHDIKEIKVCGDMAYTWAKLAVRITPAGAPKPIERVGNTLTIFHRVGGKWLLARDANLLVTISE